MKTYSQKASEISRRWHILDATGVSMGRIATVAARLLIGKDKPTFTPHMDGGDHVVIINAGQMRVTGNKEAAKSYHYHSGYPGGLRTQKISDLGYKGALEEAVRGMLPVNKLRDARLARLKVYEGAEHQHTAQKPVVYDLKGKR